MKVEDSYACVEKLEYGVAKGSVLGPIFFNIYTRSFPGKLKSMGFDVKGFADDHQLWKQFNPLFRVKVLGVDINRCFEAIATWMNEFFLHLNASKTKILIVAPPSVKSSIHINGTFVNGTCIRFVDSAKNLGIAIDNEISFDVQINKVVSSCLHNCKNIKNQRLPQPRAIENSKDLISFLKIRLL